MFVSVCGIYSFVQRNRNTLNNSLEEISSSLSFGYKSLLHLESSATHSFMISSKIVILSASISFQVIFLYYEGMLASFMTTGVVSAKKHHFLKL